jgi:hypothetical protein
LPPDSGAFQLRPCDFDADLAALRVAARLSFIARSGAFLPKGLQAAQEWSSGHVRPNPVLGCAGTNDIEFGWLST